MQDFSGNRVLNASNYMFTLDPNYTNNTFSLSDLYCYMGNRATSVANTFPLPDVDQFDTGFGYTFTRPLAMQGNLFTKLANVNAKGETNSEHLFN